MEARPRVLTELLNGNQQFEIPLYQRRYSWEDGERAQFWADVLKASELQGNKFHFLGPVVFTKPESGMGGVVLTRARLIDGQQRLTTLTLLMQAVAEQLGEGVIQLPVAGSQDMQAVDASAIREDYLLNKRLTGDSRYKLLPTLADRDTLKHILTGEPLPERHSGALLAGIEFFRKRLNDPGVSVEKVLTGLNRLEVVEVMLNDGRDDPQLIFESLNSTGKDLTPADLIRNNVLMGLKAQAQDELTRTYWLPIEALFEEDGPEVFNRFMRDFLTVRMRELVDKNKVYEAFKAHREGLGEQEIQVLVSDIYDMAKLYAKALHPERVKDSPPLRLALHDLLGVRVRVTSPFLLELLEDHAKGTVTTDDLVGALRAVEAFLVRRAVSEFRSAPLNKLFATAGSDLVRGQGSAAYRRSVEGVLMKFQDRNRGGFPSDEVFLEKLRSVDLYNSDACRHVLVRLERHHNPSELVATERLTIEHILPQNPSPVQPWRDALGPDWAAIQDQLKHTLGNLTLTGYNSELGDRPFEEKKTLPIKAGDTEDSAVPKGYKFSNIAMTRELAELPVWNAQTIMERAEKLAQVALKLWPLPAFTPQELEELRAEGRRKRRDSVDVQGSAVAASGGTFTFVNFLHVPAQGQEVLQELTDRTLALGATTHVTRSYRAFRDQQAFMEVRPRADGVNVALKLAHAALGEKAAGWLSGGSWINRTVSTLSELEVVWPVVQLAFERQKAGTDEQHPAPGVTNEQYKAAKALFQALLNIGPDVAPDMQVEKTSKSIKYLVAGKEFARVYSSLHNGAVGLRLNIRPDRLSDPQQVVGVTAPAQQQGGYVEGHAAGTGHSLDVFEHWKDLLKQAYEAHRAPVQ